MSNEFISVEALLEVGTMFPDAGDRPVVRRSHEEIRLHQGGNLFNFPYLISYLAPAPEGLGAKTILIETQFTSRDFLSDYTSYYASCKRRYDKECRRVHFFSEKFTKSEIDQWLFTNAFQGTLQHDPSAHYLGYVVVKPIPFSFMGTTLLKPYPDATNSRHFTATREYRVNIFGKVLRINTLAFQSQDKATSACASSALWSAFHKTSVMFQTPCPSPSEITAFSENLFTSDGRTFPNTGLDNHQLCKAIEKIGLVSELRNQFVGWEPQKFKGFIYAYLRMGLPVLLGMQIVDAEKHLVTLTGYRRALPPKSHSKGFHLVSDSIERFYAHDDQLGPFTRMAFKRNEAEKFPGKIEIITGWPKDGTFDQLRSARLQSLLIPVHPFIRIGFEEIYQLAQRLDTMIDEGGTDNVWDIFLDDGSRLKANFSALRSPADRSFNISYLQSILLLQIPRFVWRAQLYFQGFPVMELLFDATDVPRGHHLISTTFYNPDFQDKMLSLLQKESPFAQALDQSFGTHFRKILLRNAMIPIFAE